jgi:hypothetical protein
MARIRRSHHLFPLKTVPDLPGIENLPEPFNILVAIETLKGPARPQKVYNYG